MTHKWYCFYHLINNHLEHIMDTKDEAEHWLKFFDNNPRNFVIEVVE